MEVWAPQARSVRARWQSAGSEQQRELVERAPGFWQLPPELLPAAARGGAPYQLSLDGGPWLPDPRSQRQAQGVHGPSERVARGFSWTDARFQPAPWASAVLYEAHVGTFTEQGTFLAAIERLDHLAALGVTHLQLMPIAHFAGERGWGYDGVDLFAPHAAYGTAEELKRLVDACHARGLGVIVDVVYNHLGPEGNYLGHFGPYFSKYYQTPWGTAFNLDGHGSDEVRRFFCDNALYWLEVFHFDGLRLDAVPELVDRSALHFLEQLAGEVSALATRLGRPKVLIAESDLNDPKLVRRRPHGYGLDAQWSDDFHHAVRAFLSGERAGYYADFGTLEDIAEALSAGFVRPRQFRSFRGRAHGRALGGVPLGRLVGFLQNHDQVGNRPRGDRLGHGLSLAQRKWAAALLLTGPFVPMLFQGEEWNATAPFHYFANPSDPELAQSVRRGRERELLAFGWADPQPTEPESLAAFEQSRLNWAERQRGEHAELLQWYRQLLSLRASEPALQAGASGGGAAPQVELEEARVLTVQRGDLTAWFNAGAGAATLVAPPGSQVLLAEGAAWGAPAQPGTPGSTPPGEVVHLGPWGVLLLRRAGRSIAQ